VTIPKIRGVFIITMLEQIQESVMPDDIPFALRFEKLQIKEPREGRNFRETSTLYLSWLA
jgi:hypothetical protein